VSERVTLDTTPDGRLIAVKRSRGPDDAPRLQHEADVLEAARHPGVVELVRLEPGDIERGEPARLVTVVVGSGPLGLLPRPAVPQVAAIAAAVATTLADLHLHGIAHHRVDGSHVLIDTDGRPVLCGLAEATTTSGDGSGPAEDVAGLGRLVLDLLGHDTDLEPIPDLRRRASRRRRGGWTGYQLRALLTLADQASADDPRHRPSARAFAAAVSAAFPDARLLADAALDGPTEGADHAASSTGPAEPTEAAEERGRAPRVAGAPLRGAAARRLTSRPTLVGGGAVLVGVLGLTSLAAGTSTVRGGERPEVQSAPTSTSSTLEASTATTAPAASCRATDGPAADLDGDGCADGLSVDGTVVSGDGRRFQVGEEGDEVVVGDWDCDGSATPALLRPDEGEVFVFTRWARDGADVTATAADEVAGATGIEVRTDEGCDHLVVQGPDGEHELDLRGAPPVAVP
jgi:hypothetical protein